MGAGPPPYTRIRRFRARVTDRRVPSEAVDEDRYLPIGEHGLIGNLRTVALVGTDGTIDWCCVPRFDAPSVFASILDADKGGFFELRADVPSATTSSSTSPTPTC